jgi:hypothetical protein
MNYPKKIEKKTTYFERQESHIILYKVDVYYQYDSMGAMLYWECLTEAEWHGHSLMVEPFTCP